MTTIISDEPSVEVHYTFTFTLDREDLRAASDWSVAVRDEYDAMMPDGTNATAIPASIDKLLQVIVKARISYLPA